MNENDILTRIRDLVNEEHELREGVQDGSLAPQEEQGRLRELEEALDQCWDLLRQRRARAEFGQDPDDAAGRSRGEVEGYMQ